MVQWKWGRRHLVGTTNGFPPPPQQQREVQIPSSPTSSSALVLPCRHRFLHGSPPACPKDVVSPSFLVERCRLVVPPNPLPRRLWRREYEEKQGLVPTCQEEVTGVTTAVHCVLHETRYDSRKYLLPCGSFAPHAARRLLPSSSVGILFHCVVAVLDVHEPRPQILPPGPKMVQVPHERKREKAVPPPPLALCVLYDPYGSIVVGIATAKRKTEK